MKESDQEPVLIVTNKEGRLIHAGQPDNFKKKLIGEYAQKGYKIETITIKEFREKEWKWHWDKEKSIPDKP